MLYPTKYLWILCYILEKPLLNFFGLVIRDDDRRLCVFLSLWHFYNVNDLNDKPHSVGKAWCWGKNMNFWIGMRRYVCMCIYVCMFVYIYVYTCMYVYWNEKIPWGKGSIDIRQSYKWLLDSMFPFGYPFLPFTITFLVIFIYLWKWMCVVSPINVIRYSLWPGGCWTTWGTP